MINYWTIRLYWVGCNLFHNLRISSDRLYKYVFDHLLFKWSRRDNSCTCQPHEIKVPDLCNYSWFGMKNLPRGIVIHVNKWISWSENITAITILPVFAFLTSSNNDLLQIFSSSIYSLSQLVYLVQWNMLNYSNKIKIIMIVNFKNSCVL